MIKDIESNLQEVYDTYPYVKRILLPTKYEFPIMLEGYLVTSEDCQLYHIKCEEDAALCSFYARVIIKNDYIVNGIDVYDLKKKIPAKYILEIHNKHAHFNGIDTTYGTLLCTHIRQDFSEYKNPILHMMNSAHYLYLSYINLLNGNEFVMDEYSHGLKGREEFENERRGKYGTRKH